MITLPLMMTALVTLVFLAQDKACCYNLLQWLPPNNRHARACCSAPYRATSLCTPSEPWKLVVFFPRRIPSPWNRTITWRKANWHPWRIHRKKQICIGYPTYSIHSFIIFPMNIAMIGPFDKNSRVSCPSMSGEVEGGRRRRRSRSGRHHHKRQGPQGDTFMPWRSGIRPVQGGARGRPAADSCGLKKTGPWLIWLGVWDKSALFKAGQLQSF